MKSLFSNSNKDEIKKYGKIDIPLLVVTLCIVAFGIMMVYSASMYSAYLHYGNPFFYMWKQLIGAIMGIAAMVALSFINYHTLKKLRWPILAVSFILLGIIFIPGVGVEHYGARRWINLPFLSLQPSEISKFAFIIWTASYMAKNHGKMRKFRYLVPVLIVGLLTCVLIILQPNMSIVICIGLLMLTMLFLGGAKIKHFIMMAIPLVAVVVTLILIEPYRMRRMMAFINPWASPLGEGFQLIQSLYSLGSGGLFGIGLFNSRQKYLFLPFSESDFILSIIGEELGLVGVLILFVAYAIMIYRAIRISQNASDRLGSYMASGIAAIISIQVLVNVAVVTGSIPPTGLPLPFISAGGSSLLVFLSSIGILQSISRNSHRSVNALSMIVRKKIEKPKKLKTKPQRQG
ncbi:MAG: putative lipid II flippase FtsW [Firmicutes bacterium]|nr:putative lipid II flippase FtsW [Bacillota bacterium]